jgi:hypothetical protein
MDPIAILLLLLAALVGGVIGVWQARRSVHRRVRAHIEAAVEARLVERFGRRGEAPHKADAAKRAPDE